MFGYTCAPSKYSDRGENNKYVFRTPRNTVLLGSHTDQLPQTKRRELSSLGAGGLAMALREPWTRTNSKGS